MILNRVEHAEELFNSGYSCSQAVFLAFADTDDLSREQAAKLSSEFGGGIGGLQQTCGALCAAMMVLAQRISPADPTDVDGKSAARAQMGQLGHCFADAFGTMQCHDLLDADADLPPREDGRKMCTKYVRFCAEMLERMMDF